MATKKTTALTANTTPAITDIMAMVDDPGGTPVSQKITFANHLKVVNGLTEDAAPVAGDFILSYDTSASAAKKVNFNKFGQIVLTAGFTATNPADSTTYYFGSNHELAMSTSAVLNNIYLPRACTLTTCHIKIRVDGTTGTTETSTMSFRYNNTTDTTLSSAVTATSGVSGFTNTGLSVACAQFSYFEIKWVTPAWVTNPTTVYGRVVLMFE